MSGEAQMPVFDGADSLTGHCTAAIKNGRFVDVAGGAADLLGVDNIPIAHSAAGGANCVGVARTDGILNEEIPMYNANQVPLLEIGADVVVGPLTSDGQGRAVQAADGDTVLATALQDKTGVGTYVVARLKV